MFCISRFKDIEKREYECEVVTPLFLGGADPKKAELRVPPIKAAMRFWWRALNPQNTKDLKEKESALFGDAGEKYGKSKMILSISEHSIKTGSYQPMPHHDVKPKNFTISCLMGTFKLMIQGAKQQHELFRLFSLLGGLGKRSRRGFGSIIINKIDCESSQEYFDLEKILNLINRLHPGQFVINNDKIQRNSEISNISYAFLKAVKIGAYYNSVDKLLKKIGFASHNYNSDYTGFAKGRERFASPIYVTVNRSEKGFYPVLTILNTAFKNHPVSGKDTTTDFIKAIVGGDK